MKKIVVTTTYYLCSSDFVEDYIEGLCVHNEALVEGKQDFLNGEKIAFRSSDPTSETYAVSEYQLLDEEKAKE